MIKIRFNKIYCKTDEYKFLNLVFLDEKSSKSVFFEGYKFFYESNSEIDLGKFTQIKYKEYSNEELCIESIRESWDVYFLKINNGDIFQIFQAADGVSPQQLFIYEKSSKNPLTSQELSEYKDAYERFINSDEIEI